MRSVASTSSATRRLVQTPVVGLALLGALAAGCGGRTDVGGGAQTTPETMTGSASTGGTGASTGEGTGSTPSDPSSTPNPLGIPSDVPGGSPTFAPNPSVTPKPFTYDGPINKDGSRPVTADALNSTYDTFIGNLSGLFSELDPAYATALREVATPRMTLAITRAAKAIQDSKSHAVGMLMDKNRTLTVKGNNARIISCLDEKTWYVVKDETNEPDPGISRGFFVGRATMVYADGRWFVDTWNSLPQNCRY